MAYVNFSTEKNFYQIIRNFSNKKREFKSKTVAKGVEVLLENGVVEGVQLNEVFTQNEILGHDGEEVARKFFEQNKIPYFFIGQGPTGIEKSKILKERINAHRPDFLVNIPDIGCVFFDVKVRALIGFKEKENNCFSLYKHEAEQLLKLQDALMIPVWIAFLNKKQINFDKLPSFYLLSGSVLRAVITHLKQDMELYHTIGILRIPLSVLQCCQEKLSFNIGIDDQSGKDLQTLQEKYAGLIRRIEDEIKWTIRNHKLMKSKLSNFILSTTKFGKNLRDIEINLILAKLIENGTVIFESKKPLKLRGE